MRQLTLGSLFDGIGGCQIAAVHAGVRPVWSSEIEQFPMRVTKKWFPNTKQLGDITKLDGAKLEPVDIICAGSPCQDLSMAGKRKGLAGERSGLFTVSVDIVRRMRDATGGRFPRFFVWENVPGAFSSNKRQDFRAVLEEIGQANIPMPKSGRWADAGLVRTHTCDIAWRVLDAQYWGVPQRRKRIFLVADFAETGRRAAEILFERESVQGDTPQGEGTRKGTAAGAQSGAGTASLGLDDQGGGRMDAFTDIAPTLRAQAHNHPPVVHTYTIMGNIIGRQSKNGGHQMGIGKDVAPTLNTIDRHAVVSYASQSYTEWKEGEPMTTLRAFGGFNGGGSENLVTYNGGTVRRLTPLECERLQGLPDGWTEGGSDTARYKAIGNGMAQPCADFVIRRIVEEVTKQDGDTHNG